MTRAPAAAARSINSAAAGNKNSICPCDGGAYAERKNSICPDSAQIGFQTRMWLKIDLLPVRWRGICGMKIRKKVSLW